MHRGGVFRFGVFLLQTSRIEFDLPEYSVRRRYQDFDWLRMKLEESQPTHLIPVRPGSAAPPAVWLPPLTLINCDSPSVSLNL